jgi:DNA adenine methylase
MKPAVSYYGGKQRLAKRIVQLLPPHQTYCEPFCGGAAVMFAKPQPAGKTIEILNDLDQNLIALYRCIREMPNELLRYIQYTPYSEAEHHRAKAILKASPAHSLLETAWAYYTCIMQSFGNNLNGGWGRGKKEPQVTSWQNHKTRLAQIFQRLETVHITCEDALKSLHRWDSPTTVFYLDPPYPGSNQGHYKGFTQQHFEQLLEFIAQAKGTCLLSCYPNTAVPTHWQKHEFKARTTVNNIDRGMKRDRTECAWIIPGTT